MSKNRKKSKMSFTVVTLFLILAVYYVWKFLPDVLNINSVDNDKATNAELNSYTASAEGNMEIHIIDVGQGDSILFKTDAGNVLFDAGTNSSEDDLKAYLKNSNVNDIEYAIFTHPHEDHIGGADMVVNDFNVKNIIMPDAETNTKTYDRLLTAIEDKNVNTYMAKSGDVYNVGDLKMTILSPNSDSYSNLNNYSVVVKLEYGNCSFLLTGDAEKEAEAEILAKYNADILKCDFLKLGHHGSNTSSSQEFLAAVNPSIAVISCGVDNSYGHPHSETITKLNNLKITYFRTDTEGSLVFNCNGIHISKN